MEKQNHIFDELRVIFSQERLDVYLSHADCNNSKNEALVAYSWNIELCQALYPALQVLEITLRNSLHKSIANIFKTEEWFNLPFLHKKEQVKISKAKLKLQKENKIQTPGRVIAELSFGFWTSLFDVRYEFNQVLWPKIIKPSFPYLPKNQKSRIALSKRLTGIKHLRNRIFHYEPIWHWKDLAAHHNSILNLIRYISPSALRYLSSLDNFVNIYAAGKEQVEIKLKDFIDNYSKNLS